MYIYRGTYVAVDVGADVDVDVAAYVDAGMDADKMHSSAFAAGKCLQNRVRTRASTHERDRKNHCGCKNS